MTYQQYWNDDPYLCESYYKLHRLKIQQRNQELWLQGLYVYNAFGVVISNAFARKGSTPAKYITEPFELFPKTEQEKEAKADKQRKAAIEALNRFKALWDKKH